MKNLFFALCLFVATSLFAADPAFRDFNTNQFRVTPTRVWIKDAAKITNAVLSGTTVIEGSLIGAGSGSGDVTASGGAALTANRLALGAGSTAIKTAAGLATDGVSKMTLGVEGTIAGSIEFMSASPGGGSLTLRPVVGGLGGTVIQLPATSGVVALASQISDTLYSSAWNTLTVDAPSKNAIYDYLHLFDTDDDGKVNVLDTTAGVVETDANGVVSASTPSGTGSVVKTSGNNQTNVVLNGTTVLTNGTTGPLLNLRGKTGKMISLYTDSSVSATRHMGFGVDTNANTPTFRVDLLSTNGVLAVGPGDGTNSSSGANFATVDSSGVHAGAFYTSNSPTASIFYADPALGGKLLPATMGPGVTFANGILSADGNSTPASTNGNSQGYSDLRLLKPWKAPLTRLTTNTVYLSFLSAGKAYHVTATNSINIAFLDVPTDTNSITDDIILIVTNTASASTNVITPAWPTADSDWRSEQDPYLIPLKTMEFRFHYEGGRVVGSYDGPHLAPNEFTTGTLTASSATTNYIANLQKEGDVAVLSNDMFLFTTNRPTSEYTIARTYQLLVRASGANRAVQMHSSFKAPMDNTNLVFTVTNGTAMMISITSHGPSETNTYFSTRMFQ